MTALLESIDDISCTSKLQLLANFAKAQIVVIGHAKANTIYRPSVGLYIVLAIINMHTWSDFIQDPHRTSSISTICAIE